MSRPLRHGLRAPLLLVTALAVVAAMGGPRSALAQEEAQPRAEELFRRGKALLANGDYVKACPLLATSFDLDPGTGVLLALAICHEGVGKLASASAEYKQAAERAKREGRADRERVARERARALEPRLSTLTVVPPPDSPNVPDLAIRRSGVLLDPNEWNTAVALDGGDYVIEASAPGKKPWRANVTLSTGGDRRAVSIPALEDALPPPTAAVTIPGSVPASSVDDTPKSRPERRPRSDPATTNSGFSTLQIAGLGAIGAGAVGVGIGTIYALRALDLKQASNRNGCAGDVCEGQGKADRLAARSSGNTATVAFAVGATLAVGGVVALLLGGNDTNAEARSPTPAVVLLEPGGAMIAFRGSLK